MENTPEIKELYTRFLLNEVTAVELGILLKHFDQLEEQDLRFLVRDSLENQSAKEVTSERSGVLLNKLNQRIDSKSVAKVKLSSTVVANYNKSIFLKIAASFLFVLGLSALAYLYVSKTVSTSINVKPGGNYATLNLSGGRSVSLQDGAAGLVTSIGTTKIYKKTNGEVVYLSYAKDGFSNQLNTLVTPKGGQYKVTLSDGSIVMLNSGSTLKFPNGFYGGERVVTVTGEAYFEVAKNPLKPFIVHCGNITTRVLGTKFNISAYKEDSQIKATLLSGKIKVSQNSTQNSVVLLPGEQASVDNSSLAVNTVNAEDYTEWRNGVFFFSNENLASVMHHLSRWYNIDVDYASLPDKKLYIKINKNVNLADVLRMISTTSNLKFQIKEGRLTVIN